MTRRLLCAFACAALAGASAVSATFAQPPKKSEPRTIAVETPSMSPEEGATCPYLRQQMRKAPAVASTDGRAHGVLDNLERLTEANELLELAEVLANEGDVEEAMECCDRAAQLCPGSPTADRAVDTKTELALGIVRPPSGGEETTEAEEQEIDWWNSLWLDLFEQMGLPLKQHGEPEGRNSTEALPQAETETGNREMVRGLMKACHLLMSQGMHHEAAEVARQAFALDPEFVQADPLIYKMHLLAASPSSDTSEASEPPTCPYCGKAAQPIRGIVAEPEQRTTQLVPHLPDVDVDVVPALERVLTEEAQPTAGAEEASETAVDPNLDALRKMIENTIDATTNADGSLRLSVDCSLGGSLFHLRYTHGGLAIWKSPDASTIPPK
jgi:tetratricopeptide (TPR) repeat protein